MGNLKKKVPAMSPIVGKNRLMLHDGDDQEARGVSQVSRTNHRVVSAPMAVYAGFRNLQGATVPLQCRLTPNLFGARLEDQLHQLGFRADGALRSRMNGFLPRSYRWRTR